MPARNTVADHSGERLVGVTWTRECVQRRFPAACVPAQTDTGRRLFPWFLPRTRYISLPVDDCSKELSRWGRLIESRFMGDGDGYRNRRRIFRKCGAAEARVGFQPSEARQLPAFDSLSDGGAAAGQCLTWRRQSPVLWTDPVRPLSVIVRKVWRTTMCGDLLNSIWPVFRIAVWAG